MQKLLSLLLIVALLISATPTLAQAQSQPSDDHDAGYRLLLPLVYQEDTTTITEEEPIDSGLPSTGIGPEQLVAAQREEIVSQSVLPPAFAALQLTESVVLSDVTRLFNLLPSGVNVTAAQSRQQVVVRLREPSVVEYALHHAVAGSTTAYQAQLAVIEQQQANVIADLLQLDSSARVLGRVQKALNAVILAVDEATLPQLTANPAVLSVRPVINYAPALTETVPYIGGSAVQALGYNGAGVTVAVLDSGVDYTHANLGGPGSLAAYAAAYGTAPNDPANTTRDALFPTAKIIEGYDFIGESWPDGELTPDDDPIDRYGHGTHVADIIGGVQGVAPGVTLYALKVCSAVEAICSGAALLQALDYVLDPNEDGDMTDAIDIVTLSLGNKYGLATDDNLAWAVDYAGAFGVLVVAAAGNDGDKPYVLSSPAAATAALAVAQTHVPTALERVMEVKAPPTLARQYEAVFQPWSVAPTAAVQGLVQYGDGGGGNRNGCLPFATGTLAGKIVLVDRGDCFFTTKIVNIGQAGGIAGIIGLVTPVAPFASNDGGTRPLIIPGYMVSQQTANLIKNALSAGVVVRFDPNTGLPLVGHMVKSSARGPSNGTTLIKPDLGAPGAAVSADAGSGIGKSAFGGTSGAAAMVAGAAALLRQAFPNRSAMEIKALLMNTAETSIMNSLALYGGELAPITRIGGGEVRVDRAFNSPAAAWDVDAQTGSLSFGFQDVSNVLVLKRLVNVRNYSNRAITYRIRPTFRFANDTFTNAVKVIAPATVLTPAGGDAQFEVEVTIQSANLRPWTMNSGFQGSEPAPLTRHEYDGYLQLVEAGNANNHLHLAWHLLPRAAGDISLTAARSFVQVLNRGVGASTIESYSLIGVSGNLPSGSAGANEPIPDFRYLGYRTIAVPTGYCNDTTPSFLLAFAANTWERQTHADAPAGYRLAFDTNRDGVDDYAVLSRAAGDGNNITWVVNLATDVGNSTFYTDHETNSANTVLYICAEHIGLSRADFYRPLNLTAYLDDVTFGGRGDVLRGITIAPFSEQYIAKFDQGGIGATTLAAGARDRLRVLHVGPLINNTESGLLLLFRGGAPATREAGTVVVLR